ncbi:MAG TPA: hypothetical protein VMW45_04550 [Dehalococcoidia bacterium]|nr:hypothetical protein [Dehalococcoidia bacterium]
MKAELQEAINTLPVIQKAHIYEPNLEDVAEVTYLIGLWKVINWINSHKFGYIDSEGKSRISYAFTDSMWQAQLQKWAREVK